MISTVFYILSSIYVLQCSFDKDFNNIGKEFTLLVILGLVAILEKK
jgi:hypothetical protein